MKVRKTDAFLAEEVVLRRAMHGHRDLPRRLLETPSEH